MDEELIWKALSDPSRRAILDGLRRGPKTTGAISNEHSQTRYGIMKHLSVLEDCGLITVQKSGRERWNYLNGAALTQATSRWLDPFQSQWAGRLRDLGQKLDEDKNMNTALGIDIRQETQFASPKEDVFRALTQDINSWWKQGYRQAGKDSKISLDPEIGSKLLETNESGHSAVWGSVEEVCAPDLIYLSGRFAVAGALAGRVHFDLEETEGGCRLILTHQAVGKIPDEMRASFSKGWKDLIESGLVDYLKRAAS